MPSAHLARRATVPQLRRMCARHAFDQPGGMPVAAQDRPAGGSLTVVRDPLAGKSQTERRACAKPELVMSYDADGRFHLRYSAPATVGALVEQAIREAKDALFAGARGSEAGGDGEPETSAGEPARMAGGGAVAAAGRSGAGRSGDAGRPTYADALEELANRSLASITSTSRASHYRVYLHLSTDGAWADGGATDEDNQVSLCPHHHDALDRGDFALTGDPTHPEGLVATNRYGIRIRPPRPVDTGPPPGGDPPVPPGAYQPPTGEAVRWQDLEIIPDADLRAR